MLSELSRISKNPPALGPCISEIFSLHKHRGCNAACFINRPRKTPTRCTPEHRRVCQRHRSSPHRRDADHTPPQHHQGKGKTTHNYRVDETTRASTQVAQRAPEAPRRPQNTIESQWFCKFSASGKHPESHKTLLNRNGFAHSSNMCSFTFVFT